MKVVPEYEGAERRRARRIPICVPATAECDSFNALCYLRDLSSSGLYMISQKLPSLAVGFSVSAQLPGAFGILRARAQVVRVQGDGPRGFGLTFVDLATSEKERLALLDRAWAEMLDKSIPPV